MDSEKIILRVSSENELKEFTLLQDNSLTIQVNEFDYIDIEFVTDTYFKTQDLKLFIGNTIFNFSEPIEINGQYFYYLDLEFISNILPGNNNAHISKVFYKTSLGNRRFSRIFINEIGIAKLEVLLNSTGEALVEGKVQISSSKITYDNFYLVTTYLISNNYFDNQILYKVSVTGNSSNIQNSLIEALRELLRRLKVWSEEINKFKTNSIKRYHNEQNLVSFNKDLELSDISLNYIVDNLNTLSRTNFHKHDEAIEINNSYYIVESILIDNPISSTDSYENRVIHGFLKNLSLLVKEKELYFNNEKALRTRVVNFKDYLINCFLDLFKTYIHQIDQEIDKINLFFIRHVPVSHPISKLNNSNHNFLSKEHYKNVYDLILYTQNIFSVDIEKDDLSLEIESFDKLFEVYCFYLLKDILERKTASSFTRKSTNISPDNKLSGEYELKKDSILIRLHYESLPVCFQQYSRGNLKYRPDFLIEFENNGKSKFFIFDAKFKQYNTLTLEQDLSKLSLNYLHKIGPNDRYINETIGLYTISMGPSNYRKSTFKKSYDLSLTEYIGPQIGSIEIDPKNFDISKNPILEIIDYAMHLTLNEIRQ
ncbi:hypothetical protein C3K47_08760 [Solitalea longa]|uniref:DUF2357 domain-containing protein n=1 Tax=Solitalea longa TaxID=2079460 RepID=A0A2S5A3I7_9SPHI|nr:hypothetical protein [Solitalea longa]POY37138.1 hypothetical protein C3K47_08760 [Solitalea longa]